jgi:hypothetical protein
MVSRLASPERFPVGSGYRRATVHQAGWVAWLYAQGAVLVSAASQAQGVERRVRPSGDPFRLVAEAAEGWCNAWAGWAFADTEREAVMFLRPGRPRTVFAGQCRGFGGLVLPFVLALGAAVAIAEVGRVAGWRASFWLSLGLLVATVMTAVVGGAMVAVGKWRAVVMGDAAKRAPKVDQWTFVIVGFARHPDRRGAGRLLLRAVLRQAEGHGLDLVGETRHAALERMYREEGMTSRPLSGGGWRVEFNGRTRARARASRERVAPEPGAR